MIVDQIFQTAQTAIKRASQIVIDAHLLPKIAEHKGKTDLVTKTDRLSETGIIQVIQNTFPNHGIIAEESDPINSDSEYQWIIDPLDGTTNFVHGYPLFAISIGIMYNNEIICGTINELPANIKYWAIKDQGAFCDGIPITVSNISTIDNSLLVTGFSYDHDEKWNENFKLMKNLSDRTRGVLHTGTAAVNLCHVASGKVDGFWEFDLKPWDVAAGMLIVTEAGGEISKMDGGDFSLYQPQILATNTKIHREILDVTEQTVQKLQNKGIEI